VELNISLNISPAGAALAAAPSRDSSAGAKVSPFAERVGPSGTYVKPPCGRNTGRYAPARPESRQQEGGSGGQLAYFFRRRVLKTIPWPT